MKFSLWLWKLAEAWKVHEPNWMETDPTRKPATWSVTATGAHSQLGEQSTRI